MPDARHETRRTERILAFASAPQSWRGTCPTKVRAMATTLRRIVIAISLGVGLLVFGVLIGIAIDQMRFDRHRAAVLKPYEDALRHRNEALMSLELATTGRHRSFETQWRQSLEDIDNARQTGNPGRAVAAWREAYRAAVRTGRWDTMIDVGDAALRVGAVPGLREPPEAAARRSYLPALVRARGQRSLEGILRACEGFALLGDMPVVQQCLAMGHETAKSDPVADARVTAFARRFIAQPVVAAEPAPLEPGF